jgi:nickel transport protein
VPPRIALPLLLAGLLARPAFAHEVTAEVARDRAVAVRARTHDGPPLSDAAAEVFSPADPSAPYWKGRTDRNGWVTFVPDAPGRWRVRVIDATGHGIDTPVEVPASGDVAPRADGPAPAASVLGALAGVALIGAFFGVLHLRGRRPGA